MYVAAIAEETGVEAEIVSTASYGQKANDVLVSYNGSQYGIEVKGTRDTNKLIPMFDRSVRRRKIVPTDIEAIASAYIETLSLGGASIKKLMTASGYAHGFLGLLEFFRDHTDGTVGLAEDDNTTSSGKLPKELASSDPFVLKSARSLILTNLKAGQDAYFAVHDKNRDEVDIFYTGYGPNFLDMPRFPTLHRVVLDTYGGASAGATRVAFKVKLYK